MAVTIAAAPSGTHLSPAVLPVMVGATVYLLLLLNGGALLNDPDSYSHVALGRWIIEHRAVPFTDPFSATFAGAPWVAFEWLSDVLYAGAFAVGGWNGVAVLASFAFAAALANLSRFLLRQLDPVATIVLVCAAFVLLTPHVLARPHVLALPIMVAWTGTLLRASEEGRRPPLALLALMVVWANLHGSFAVGLAMIAPITFEALLGARPAERVTTVLRWAGFALLAVLAAMVNPAGPEVFAVIYRTFALGKFLGIISEWRPQDFSHLGAFEIVICSGIGYALYSGIKIGWTRVLIVLGLLHMALAQTRHGDLLGLLAPLFLARPLAEHLVGRAAVRTGGSEGRVGLASAGAGALMLAATSALVLSRPLSPSAAITPAAAVAAADLAHAGPLLNDYGFGAYLDFVGIAPFIDGRAELYGAEFAVRHHQAVTLNDLPGLLDLLERYGIQATLLAPATPANAFLDRLPGWQRVYADDVAVVHLRRAAAPG